MGVASAEPLWRAIAVYRFASIGYAVLLAVINRADYSRPGWAWVVIAAMIAWTAVTTVAYAHPERRTRLLLSADLAVTGITPCRIADGYCSAAVDSSRPAVTARSALSSSRVRRSGSA